MDEIFDVVFEFADTDDAVMLVSCNACRRVYFADGPECAVEVAMGHAANCDTEDVLVVECLPPQWTPQG